MTKKLYKTVKSPTIISNGCTSQITPALLVPKRHRRQKPGVMSGTLQKDKELEDDSSGSESDFIFGLGEKNEENPAPKSKESLAVDEFINGCEKIAVNLINDDIVTWSKNQEITYDIDKIASGEL